MIATRETAWVSQSSAWAESRPDLFEPLYGVVENDPKMRIYRLRPNGSHLETPLLMKRASHARS